MRLWMKPAKIIRPYLTNFMTVLRIIKPKTIGGLGSCRYECKFFCQHGDKDIREFEYGKLLVPKHVHQKLPCIMQKLHEWYYLACVYGLNFIEAKISGDIFNTSIFDLNVKLAELHTIYRLQMLDIAMMTV
jgi:hypothetical protein